MNSENDNWIKCQNCGHQVDANEIRLKTLTEFELIVKKWPFELITIDGLLSQLENMKRCAT